jgi:hypothetical protein
VNKNGSVSFRVGVGLLTVSALLWLPFIFGVAADPEDVGGSIGGGVVLTFIPVAIGIFGVWRGRASGAAALLRSWWTERRAESTLASLVIGGTIAVGIFFAATMKAPGGLVFVAYSTVVPGILAAAVVLSKLTFRDLQIGGPAAWLLGTYAVIFLLFIYPAGGAEFGWGWPANAWRDIYSPDVVIRALVDNKEIRVHESDSSTSYTHHIHADGDWWEVSESTYDVIGRGERVEIAFKPHTKYVRYIAYNLAEGDRIRVAVGLAPSERKVFEDAILPEFKRSDGISVEFVQIESGQLLDVLREEAGGPGVPFDLLAVDNNSLAPLVAEGLVEDLTEDTPRIPDGVLDSMLPVTQFEGHTFFFPFRPNVFPFRPNVQITFYNSEKFGEMGMEAPRTWDDLLDCAQMMKKEDGKGRLALKGVVGGPNAVQVAEFIWQADGDPLALNDGVPSGVGPLSQ